MIPAPSARRVSNAIAAICGRVTRGLPIISECSWSRLGHSDRKIVQDRAIRPIPARATTREIFERLTHGAELALLDFHFLRPRERERLDLTARTIAVLPERDELRDLGNGEAEIARAPDEA